MDLSTRVKESSLDIERAMQFFRENGLVASKSGNGIFIGKDRINPVVLVYRHAATLWPSGDIWNGAMPLDPEHPTGDIKDIAGSLEECVEQVMIYMNSTPKTNIITYKRKI